MRIDNGNEDATRSRLGPLVALALIVGCAAGGVRGTPETRYLGVLLEARTLGASEVERARTEDAAVRAYVDENGQPDFVVMPTPQDIELIYYLRSVLAQFHRASPDALSVMGTLTPLPNAVVDLLPSDIRAGTPAHAPEESAGGCWSVTVGDFACRTCCVSARACVGGCARGRELRDARPSAGRHEVGADGVRQRVAIELRRALLVAGCPADVVDDVARVAGAQVVL